MQDRLRALRGRRALEAGAVVPAIRRGARCRGPGRGGPGRRPAGRGRYEAQVLLLAASEL